MLNGCFVATGRDAGWMLVDVLAQRFLDFFGFEEVFGFWGDLECNTRYMRDTR